MNKLIKSLIFVVTITSSYLSPAAKYAHIYEDLTSNPCALLNLCYNIQTQFGIVISPNRFIISSHLREDINIYVGNLGIIEGNIVGYKREEALMCLEDQEITIDFLHKKNLICVVFANAEACERNGPEIKARMATHKLAFSNSPIVYTKMAKLALKKMQNLKPTIKTLEALISEFKDGNYFPPVFFYSYLINTNESSHLIFTKTPVNAIEYTELTKFKDSFLFKAIKNLAQIAMRKKLGICQHKDDFSGFKDAQSDLNFQPISQAEFAKNVENNLTDNDMIAFTICETEELLSAIKKIAN